MKVGTKVQHPLDHTSRINVLNLTKEGLPKLRQWGILNKGTRYHSRVIDGLTPWIMMEGNKMSGELMNSFVRA